MPSQVTTPASAVGDSANPNDSLSFRRKYFVIEFKNAFETKVKQYFEEAKGVTSKAGKSSDASKAAIGGLVGQIPFCRGPANAISKGIEFAGEAVHKKKAEAVTGVLEACGLSKNDLVELIVHTGLNIFYVLESQLMTIDTAKYTAGWQVAVTLIVKDLVNRAINFIHSTGKSFKISEETLADCVFSGNSKSIANIRNLPPERKDGEWILEGLPDKVGICTDKGVYYSRKGNKIEKYGCRRLFPWEAEDTIPCGYSKEKDSHSSYTYLMIKEDIEQCKQEFMEKIVKESVPLYERMDEIRNNFDELKILVTTNHASVIRKPRLPSSQISGTLKINKPEFKSPPPEILEFSSYDHRKHTLIISSHKVDITERRIRQTIRMPAFSVHFTRNLRNFLHEEADMLNLEENQMIVVTCKSKLDFESALVDLQEQDYINHSIKFVLLTEEIHEVITTTIAKLKINQEQEHIHIFTDNPGWDDLTDSCKSELLQRQILLQGHSVQLQDFCCDQTHLKILCGDMLADLLDDKRPELFPQGVQSLPLYYIRRLLRSKRFQVPLRVIEDTSATDVFVISNIKIDDFHKFKGTSGCIAESTQLITEKNFSTQRFVKLTREKHFEIICKKTSAPVHWLNYHKTHFEWVKTRGCISLMEEYTRDAEVGLVNEDMFISQCDPIHDPILISDTPGMGKTALLKSIAVELKQRHPSRLVLFFTLSEFIAELKQLYPEDDVDHFKIEDIVNLLVQQKAIYYPLVHRQLTYWLSGGGGSELMCELLFDGYDEVLPYQRNLAKKLLVWFGKHKNNFRMWVSTRPAHLKQLEETLNVLGHTIQPFHISEQLEFLTRYWLQVPSADAGKFQNGISCLQAPLSMFAELCIKGLSWNLYTFDKRMTGIPLQCFMLANIYEREALDFARAETDSSQSSDVDPTFTPINNVTDFYAKMIARKLAIFLNKRKIQVDKMDPVFIIMKNKMDQVHFRLSVELFFPSWSESLKNILPPLIDGEYDEVLSYGIVESYNLGKACSANQPPRFVHRTFAEFYLALFITDFIIKSEKTDDNFVQKRFAEFLLTEVLQMSFVSNSLEVNPQFRNIVTVHFLNEILNNTVTLNMESLKSSILVCKRAKKLIFGCLTSGKLGIFQMLISQFSKQELTDFLQLDDYDVTEILQLISRHCSSQVFSHAMDFLKSLNIFIGKDGFKEILLSAVKMGNVESVNYLISNNLEVSDWENIGILHHCLENSSGVNDPCEIAKFKNVISCLVKFNPNILEEKDAEGLTPIGSSGFPFGVPYEIFDHLVTLGADINAASVDPVQLLTSISFKIPLSLDKLVNSLKLLIQAGFNFTKVQSGLNDFNRSKYELQHLKSVIVLSPEIGEILNPLLSHVFEIDELKESKCCAEIFFICQSLTHFLALLNSFNVPLTYTDDEGDRLLHLVMYFPSASDREEILEYLLSHGVDPNQPNDDGKLPLFTMFNNNGLVPPPTLRQLQLFKSYGANILGNDDCEFIQEYLQIPHLYWLNSPCHSVVAYLIDNGADISCKVKKTGESLLHLAVKVGCLDTVKMFTTLNSSLVNTVDDDGLSALHVALTGNIVGAVCVYYWLTKVTMQNNPVFDGVDDYEEESTEKDIIMINLKLFFTQEVIKQQKSMKQAFSCSTKTRSQLLDFINGAVENISLLQVCKRVIVQCTEPDCDFIFSDSDKLPHAECWERKNGIEIVQHLLENGADVNLKDEEGNTPLHHVLFTAGRKFEGKDKVEGLLQWEQAFIPVLNLLINHGADVHCKNDNGVTCLHLASGAGLMKIVVILVEGCEVNVNIRDKEDLTAFEYAVIAGEKYNDEIIESVVEYLSHFTLVDVVEDNRRKSSFPIIYKKRRCNVL